jgi:hypothetical protein
VRRAPQLIEFQINCLRFDKQPRSSAAQQPSPTYSISRRVNLFESLKRPWRDLEVQKENSSSKPVVLRARVSQGSASKKWFSRSFAHIPYIASEQLLRSCVRNKPNDTAPPSGA